MLQQSELDPSFALGADATPPPNVKKVSFDALLLAEGEWSTTCTKLGVTKSIDRFTQAIGLVINMVLDPKEPKTKDPNMRSFTVRPIDPVGKAFKEAGIGFEFAEYLKGETHYIVVTIKKKSLLEHGVLRQVTGRHCHHSHRHHHHHHHHHHLHHHHHHHHLHHVAGRPRILSHRVRAPPRMGGSLAQAANGNRPTR